MKEDRTLLGLNEAQYNTVESSLTEGALVF
jgi:hypothetical protein